MSNARTQPLFLPEGKKAAICFSIDDIHPGKSTDAYEAGGDLSKGTMGLLEDLMSRHQELKMTVFLTADWRMIHPFVTRKTLARIPVLRDKLYLTPVLPKGTMQLRKHPEFVKYISEFPRTEIAFHGLYHSHKGMIPNLEFQEQSEEEFKCILDQIEEEFKVCGFDYSYGICPPNWLAPDNLIRALGKKNFNYLASARDLFTEISPEAKTNMSGMKGVSLIYPEWIANNTLVHLPANFNATRKIERAIAIIENGGILSIKGHIVKDLQGHILYDGIDEVYMNYLDTLFRILKDKYGDQLWFASMGEIASEFRKQSVHV